MKKFIVFLIFTSLLIISCKTIPQEIENTPIEYKGFEILKNFQTYPMNVFYGFAPYSSNEEEMKEKALYNCARNIAIYEALFISTALVTESSENRINSYASDGSALYNDELIENIVSRLNVLSWEKINTEIMVLAEDPRKSNENKPFYDLNNSKDKPEWVDFTPNSQDYLIAVGETRGYRTLQASLEAANIAAAYILMESSGKTQTQTRSYDESKISNNSIHEGLEKKTGVMQFSLGEINGFKPITFWFDSTQNKYYVLAICKK